MSLPRVRRVSVLGCSFCWSGLPVTTTKPDRPVWWPSVGGRRARRHNRITPGSVAAQPAHQDGQDLPTRPAYELACRCRANVIQPHHPRLARRARQQNKGVYFDEMFSGEISQIGTQLDGLDVLYASARTTISTMASNVPNSPRLTGENSASKTWRLLHALTAGRCRRFQGRGTHEGRRGHHRRRPRRG
jgi:hypothetical protein